MGNTILTVLSREDLLTVLRRVTPASYHAPLESTANGGWEIHEAHAGQGARISSGFVQLEQDLIILEADGPSRATGSVAFSRPDASAGAVTLGKGTELLTEDGRRYITTADAVFGALDVGPVTVAAYSAGIPSYANNCRAGDISQIGAASDSSTGNDDTIEVTNAAAFTGGSPDALQGLGWDRGIPRFRGESDADYRTRIRTLPLVVTPEAIEALCDRYEARYGVEITIIECWENAIYAGEAYCDADPDLWAYSTVTQRGAFTVWVPDVGEISDTASYVDTDYSDTDDTDGGDAAKAAIGAGLLAALDRIKGEGVAIRLIRTALGAGYPLAIDNFTDDVLAA